MGFFGFKNHWSDILKIIELMKVSIVEMAKEIDMIKEKLKSPLIKKKIKEEEVVDIPKENTTINDGFDGLRQLRKDLSMTSD
jgi:hypothetical protein